ncbi:MAG: hypothetical protein N4A63_10750 [Vallitalea sp.]|jgi:hypothetical protein|nr:hypothetical protein [Vallitalea sp.]
MPYCSKCGVEVENSIKKCPLCEYPIPNINDTKEYFDNGFPEAENIYKNRVSNIKNKVFYTLILVLFFSIPILLSVNAFFPAVRLSINYVISCIIAAMFYIYFLFGYLKLAYNILGIGITSIILTYKLDSIDNSITWFYKYALIIILLVIFIVYVYLYLYKRSKHQNQLIYIPSYIFSAIGILCICIEGLISYRFKNYIKLTWSVIVLISTFSICILLLSLYHGLPEKFRAKLKSKLHV